MSVSLNVDPVAKAREVLAQFEIKSSPTPVERIAKALGAQIRSFPV